MSEVNTGRLKQIYNAYRNALLNRKYYGCQLDLYRKLNRTTDVILAIFTPTTAVAGWAVWKTETGATLWAWIAGGTAILALLKPFLDWPKDIDRYSRLHAEHTVLYYTFKQLVEDIETEEKITPDIEKRFLDARERYAQLSKDDDVKPRKRLARRCEQEVLREIPADRLWVPNKKETS
jgi:hypothetical protein